MAVNRFYKGTPYQASLYTPPVEFIATALEAAQKQYDVNYEALSKLKDTYINARNPDKPRAAEKMKEYSDAVDAIVSKYNGDYSQATKDRRELERKIKTDFSPNGEMYAIQNNYNTEVAAIQNARKRLGAKENGVDTLQLNALKSFYNRQGATTLDKDSGTWSTLEAIDLPNAYDLPKNFEEYMTKVPERTTEEMRATQDVTLDGYHVFEKVKLKGKDYKEASTGWKAMLNSDFAYQSYIQMLAKLTDQDPNAFSEAITSDYEQNIIPGRTGFTEVGKDYEFVRDYKAEEAFKAATKAKTQGFGVDMDNNGGFVTSKLKVAGNGAESPKIIGQTNYENASLLGKIGYGLMSLYPSGSYITPGDVDIMNKDLKTQLSYSEIMTSPKYANSVNRDRLKSIKEANPNMSDKDLINLYNKEEKENNLMSNVHYVAFNTTSAAQEAADRLLPGLKAGTSKVFKISADTGEITEYTGPDKETIYKNLVVPEQEKKGVIKAKQPALGFAMGYTTHLPSGSVIIPNPAASGWFDGSSADVYAIAPARNDFENAQEKLLDQLFRPLINGKGSTPIPFGKKVDGTPAYVVSKKSYVNGREVVSFHQARWNEKGQPEIEAEPILADDGSVLGPNAMEMFIMKDLFMNILPRDTKWMLTAEALQAQSD